MTLKHKKPPRPKTKQYDFYRFAPSVETLFEQKRVQKELAHTFRHLSKQEIAKQYPPRRVEALLKEAQANAKRIAGPQLPPASIDSEVPS